MPRQTVSVCVGSPRRHQRNPSAPTCLALDRSVSRSKRGSRAAQARRKSDDRRKHLEKNKPHKFTLIIALLLQGFAGHGKSCARPPSATVISFERLSIMAREALQNSPDNCELPKVLNRLLKQYVSPARSAPRSKHCTGGNSFHFTADASMTARVSAASDAANASWLPCAAVTSHTGMRTIAGGFSCVRNAVQYRPPAGALVVAASTAFAGAAVSSIGAGAVDDAAIAAGGSAIAGDGDGDGDGDDGDDGGDRAGVGGMAACALGFQATSAYVILKPLNNRR